jgi:hypothetical protein
MSNGSPPSIPTWPWPPQATPLPPVAPTIPPATLPTGGPALSTSQTSTDTLPLRGYTFDQLANYIQRKLGGPVWNVELPRQNIIDNIQDALGKYSVYRPLPRYGALRMIPGQFSYLSGVDVGQGVAYVWFLQPNPVPEELFWGNLIYPTPTFKTGLDEYDTFLRWQKTWLRVASIRPDWMWDESQQLLYIHNPLDRYMCGILCYMNWTDTQGLDQWGAQWVKDYAYQLARMAYAELMSKYSGAVPGPAQGLILDQAKRNMATEELHRLEDRLFAAQMTTPLSID